MKYKELISFLDKEKKFLSEQCIMGTFIDPSLGDIAQNYINTADKYGNSIYPLDFSKGNFIIRKIMAMNNINLCSKLKSFR